MPKDVLPSAETIQAAPAGRSGVHRLARRIREYISLIRAVCDAPDPGTPEYIEKQKELVRKMSQDHILPEDPDEAIQEYIRNGDAEFYCKGAQAKKRLKESTHLPGKNGNGSRK